ncbi:MAG: insulinase family protein [Phycisphaeraceae bacterium]|nr:insulinase family protein [Phycisphaeraceae bacterium]
MGVVFRHATLPNGLTVIAEVDSAAQTAAAGFFVRTGARDETPELMGVSHFLEHMMFKGSERMSAEAVNQSFDSIGADHNAFTTTEMTAFHAHTLPEALPTAVDTLAEILRPALRKEDFDEEKGVILEEIAMYEDHPGWCLYERTMERYFGAHPSGHRVLGTKSTIEAMTRDAMKEYFDARYSADNTVVAAAGALDFEAFVMQIAERCRDWQSTAPRRQRLPFAPGSGPHIDFHDSANRAYLMGVAPAPALDDPRRYAAGVLMHILGGGDGSRLHWALIEKGLAEEADAGHDPRDGQGIFVLSAACTPESADEVSATIEAEVKRLGESLTDDDLLRAKRKIATSAALAGERPAGRMSRIGALWTLLRRHRSLEEEMVEIERLTLDDLRSCLRDFPPAPLLTGRLLPAALAPQS